MSQATITNYFNKRKRHAVDDVKLNSKVLILENNAETKNNLINKDLSTRPSVIFKNSDVLVKTALSLNHTTCNLKKKSMNGPLNKTKSKVTFKCDIRRSFASSIKERESEGSENIPRKEKSVKVRNW